MLKRAHTHVIISSSPCLPHATIMHARGCLQGDMDPGQRDKVVQEFRDGTTKILISTDVLSRGFDVSQVRQILVKINLLIKESVDKEVWFARI